MIIRYISKFLNLQIYKFTETFVTRGYRLVEMSYPEIFYTQGDRLYSHKLICVYEDRYYENIISYECLNSLGLPADKFRLAFKTGLDTKIYKDTYSNYSILVCPRQAIVNLKIRYPLSEIDETEEVCMRNEEFVIHIYRKEFNIEEYTGRINFLRDTFFRLSQIATLHFLPTDGIESENYDPSFADGCVKNKTIRQLVNQIVFYEESIDHLKKIFKSFDMDYLLSDYLFWSHQAQE